MTSHILFAYPIKLNILTKNTVTKIHEKKLSYFSNAIKKILDKISFHGNFKSLLQQLSTSSRNSEPTTVKARDELDTETYRT